MNKKIYIIYIMLFMALCVTPLVTMPFYSNNEAAEKRKTQEFPSFMENNRFNTGYFKQITDYFNDNYGLRQELASINAFIRKETFVSSAEENVVVGTDGWLYYADTIDNYCGFQKINKRQVHNCTKVLRLIEEYVKNQGGVFLFAAAPNKNTLYDENMPYYYIKDNKKSNLDMLYEALDDNKVLNINLKHLFSSDSRILYHKLDTHWNNAGAAFAGKSIAKALNKEFVDYDKIDYCITKDFTGDLYQMLCPSGKEKDEDILYNYQFHFNYENAGVTTDMPKFATWNENATGTLVMYRDSFGNALAPFIAEEFGHCIFTKAVPYDLTDVKAGNTDCVIIELAERHLKQLQEGIPVMEAPVRENIKKCKYLRENNADIKLESGRNNELVKLYGYVDPRYTDDDSDIYVQITINDAVYTYEAFPVVDNIYLNEEMNDYGYGVYVPKELIKGGVMIEVITEKDGVFYTSGNLMGRF